MRNNELIINVLRENLGREELLEWWVHTINTKVGHNCVVSHKSLPQIFRGLKKEFVITRRTITYNERSTKAIMYEVKEK